MELPPYDSIAKALKAAGAVISPSEVHGMLCGFVCGGRQLESQTWLQTLFGDTVVDAKVLLDLHLYTVESLVEMDFEFMILLPDDEQSLEQRTEALGTWCQGFVAGLGLAGVDVEQVQQPDIQEILQSLGDISRIDFDAVDTDEEDEQAYVELVEYARMAALLVFGELALQQEAGKTGSNGPETNMLH